MTTLKLTNDGSRTLDSVRYSQTYHSINGALTEARHVFLDASGVSERLQQGQATNVLEIGFGLGLNTLLTADLAKLHNASLNYHAFEHDLAESSVIRQLEYNELLIAPEMFKAMLRMVDHALASVPAQHENTVLTAEPAEHLSRPRAIAEVPVHTAATDVELAENIRLQLHLIDAANTCFKTTCQTDFHAIYLDAFSADANPECWSPQFIARLAAVLAPDGRLSTYSARGHVRRAMLAAGLRVNKLPGPPGKREMLVGYW